MGYYVSIYNLLFQCSRIFLMIHPVEESQTVYNSSVHMYFGDVIFGTNNLVSFIFTNKSEIEDSIFMFIIM